MDILVAFFGEAVPFVLSHEIPDLAAIVADGFDDLFSFGDRDPRVVFALHDEEGVLNF